MFICQNCGTQMKLPLCKKCGSAINVKNNIYQITDMPDTVIDGGGDKYIGYEHIGENYSGNRKYIIEERDMLISEYISELTGNGIFLDLACGDGCLAVPCALNGTKVIAGDISNAMLGVLQDKAIHNKVSLDNVTLCRMNALDIPLADENIDTAVANSVLHLISNPQKVIAEIHRVLKKGGAFICVDDAPGKNSADQFENLRYNKIVSELYRQYWEELNKAGIFAKKYNWKFDRAEICEKLFESSETKLIRRGNLYRISMKEGFLPRFVARGFSDQVDVPSAIHQDTVDKLMEKFRKIYGENFADTTFEGIEDDLLIIVYRK